MVYRVAAAATGATATTFTFDSPVSVTKGVQYFGDRAKLEPPGSPLEGEKRGLIWINVPVRFARLHRSKINNLAKYV